MEELELTLWC